MSNAPAINTVVTVKYIVHKLTLCHEGLGSVTFLGIRITNSIRMARINTLRVRPGGVWLVHSYER